MSSQLSYSIHLGSNNNGIHSAGQLSKVGKHNLREYENNNDEIVVIVGSNNVYQDVQEIYSEEFEESRIEYNNKQTRDDRKISNYFDHVSKDKLRDLACEIVVELGDKDFWQDKDEKYRDKMISVYTEQTKDLTKIIPEFKIANAVVHLDETSPHMHIVGVPVSENNKRGMNKQVAKSKIFTKDSLATIQDQMRKCCIKSFNHLYREERELKGKQKGRNKDIAVKDMAEYKEIKRAYEDKNKSLENVTKSVDTLTKNGQIISNRLKLLKPSTLNKNKYVISSEDINTIQKFISETRDASKSLKTVKRLNEAVEKVAKNYNKLETKNIELERELKGANFELELTKADNLAKDNTISRLQKEVMKLKELYSKFKCFWRETIRTFQARIGFDKDEKFEEVAKVLHEKEIFTERDFEIVSDISRKVITKEELENMNIEDKVKEQL